MNNFSSEISDHIKNIIFYADFYLTFLDYVLQITKIFHHLYSRLFMFYIEGEEENKINEIESQ